MMGKVVNNDNAAFLATNLCPALHVFERSEGTGDFVDCHAPRIGGDYYGKAIKQIEFAHQCRLEFSPGLFTPKNVKARKPTTKVRIAYLPSCIGRKAKCFNCSKKFISHRFNQVA